MKHINPAPRSVRLHADDNVVVAVDVIEPSACAQGVAALRRVPRGHKMAVATIPEGAPIVKFGQVIGFAAQAIAPGDWVHEHNVAIRDFARDYRYAEGATRLVPVADAERATFQGFRRASGKVGTRNYVAVLTSVNCSASVARFMVQALERSGTLADFPGVDGVIALVHGTGCGMAAKGEGFDVLRRTEWGYASNPNIAGVLLVGLGCEVFQIGRLKQDYGIVEGDTFRTMTIQDTGGTRKTVEAGVAAIRDMLPIAARARREPVPAYDPVSATGQVAGGANVLCFTTGRGSAYGCKPTPSIKLASNSDIFRRMQDDIDINCGDVLDGVTIAEKGREIFDMILRVASGERSKSEALGYGDAEFVPWQIGATM